MSEDKICPILNIGFGPDQAWVYCQGEKCAWWNGREGCEIKRLVGCVEGISKSIAFLPNQRWQG